MKKTAYYYSGNSPITQPTPPPMLRDACSDSIERSPDAYAASGTRPGGSGPSAAPLGPRARAAGESPERSAACEATPGFKRGQAAPRLGGQRTFF